MRIAKLFLGLVFCSIVLMGQSGPRSVARPQVKVPTQELLAPCAKAALASQSLFLRLNDLPSTGAPRTLDVEVGLEGKTLASEQFHLAAASSGDLEILSRHPKLLDRIFQAAAKAGRSLRVTVRLNGTIVQEIPFQDLVVASRQLKEGGLAPLSLPSQVVDPSTPEPRPAQVRSNRRPALLTKGSEPDPECAQSCYDTYGYCSSVEQVGCECYPHCIDNCLNSCPQICSEPWYVSERTEVEVVSAQAVDYQCYEDWPEWDFYDGHYYWIYYVTYKHTRIRTTHHCDQSSTDEVLSVTYSYSYCSYQNYFDTCVYPFGPFNYPPAGPC